MFNQNSYFMKNYLLLALAIMTICFTACQKEIDNKNDEVSAITSIELNKVMVGVEIGESMAVQATVMPDHAAGKNVKWTIHDSSIATVKNGVVTGLAEGETKLTVASFDGSCSTTIPVKVVADKIAVTGIEKLTCPAAIVGIVCTARARITPNNATNVNTTLISDKPENVDIWYQGVVLNGGELYVAWNVLIKKAGDYTLTATTEDGGYTKSTDLEAMGSLVESIVVYPKEHSMPVGDKVTLQADIFPSNSSIKDCHWFSSNPSIASVDASGVVTGNAVGTATIIAKSQDVGAVEGKATVTITRRIPVERIELTADNQYIEVGGFTDIYSTVYPEGASLKDLEWSSSNQSVATISGGRVRGVSLGTATITCKTVDGSNVGALIDIMVVTPPDGVTFGGSTDKKFVTWYGREIDLMVEASPSYSDIRALDWGFFPHQDVEYEKVITKNKVTMTGYSSTNDIEGVVDINVGRQTVNGVMARSSVIFRTIAWLYYFPSTGQKKYTNSFDAWRSGNDFSIIIQRPLEKYHFVAYCPPAEYSATSSAEMYFPDSYIPTTEYTLTSNNDKITIRRLDDNKGYEIIDGDRSVYKEVVITYTCGKFSQRYTMKILPL